MILHVDLDAFYASVEQKDNPELRGQPVIVGSQPGSRGVVSACSYEARKFGIHSAMPINIAKAACPHAHFLPVRMQRYCEISIAIMETMRKRVPYMQQLSIDEAFLDIRGTEKILGAPLETAATIKREIQTLFGLTVSIGVAQNPYIAKMASAAAKPNGLLAIANGEEQTFLDSLPLRSIWGVGKQSLQKLEQNDICTVVQLRNTDSIKLQRLFGKKAGQRLQKLAKGIDPGIMDRETKSHSISNEHTFFQDVHSFEELESSLFELCYSVWFRILHEQKTGKTISIRLRYENFETHDRQKTFSLPLESLESLFEKSKKILAEAIEPNRAVRLIGIGIQNLQNQTGKQEMLFDNQRFSAVETTVVQLQKKFGKSILTKAKSLERKNKR